MPHRDGYVVINVFMPHELMGLYSWQNYEVPLPALHRAWQYHIGSAMPPAGYLRKMVLTDMEGLRPADLPPMAPLHASVACHQRFAGMFENLREMNLLTPIMTPAAAAA